MRHLTTEDLARLVDEAPEPAEREHLRGCFVCRRELAELRAQTDALASLAGEPAPEAWARLEARLAAEGLIRPAHAPPRRVRVYGMRAAAATVLFVLGGAAGAALWGGRPARIASAGGEATLPRVEATHPAAGQPLYARAQSAADGTGDAIPAPVPSARLVSTHAAPADTPRSSAPRSVPRTAPTRVTRRQAEDAARTLVEAQAAYVAALQRYAAIADPASGNDAATRLAALERLVDLTADALKRAPGDPVINGYHLAATAERDRLRRETESDERASWF